MDGSLSLRRLLATAAEHANGDVPVDGESFGASRAVLTQVLRYSYYCYFWRVPLFLPLPPLLLVLPMY